MENPSPAAPASLFLTLRFVSADVGGPRMEAAAGSPACAGVGADTSASGFEVPAPAAASSYGAGGYDTLVLMPESRAVAGYESLATAGTGSPEPEGGEAAGALLSTLYSSDLEAAGPSGQAPHSPCGAPGWVASAAPHPRAMGCARRWGRYPWAGWVGCTCCHTAIITCGLRVHGKGVFARWGRGAGHGDGVGLPHAEGSAATRLGTAEIRDICNTNKHVHRPKKVMDNPTRKNQEKRFRQQTT